MKKIFITCALALLAGCTTTGHFKVPEGANLYINDRPEPVTIGANGEVTTEPFCLTVAGTPPVGGVPYRLEKDGQIIKAGRLDTEFRVESLFFPPFAQFYWPFGFDSGTYDLVNEQQ
jgi:hypothetical protein